MAKEIKPHKVTKPIQLLAAWLVGLGVIDGSFLLAAAQVTSPSWAPGALVIAAIVNVPLFLFCIFLLQTRFRPEMQEDSYYSDYLLQQQTLKRVDPTEKLELETSLRTSVSEGLNALDSSMSELRDRLLRLETDSSGQVERAISRSKSVLDQVRRNVQAASYRVLVNDLLEQYDEIRRRLAKAHIPVSSTFGSSSESKSRPIFPVVTFGQGVGDDVIAQVCQLLKDTDSWYVSTASESRNDGSVYIGAYGYGGRAVALLDDVLLANTSEPGFSAAKLKEWISICGKAVLLDADYPPPRPPRQPP